MVNDPEVSADALRNQDLRHQDLRHQDLSARVQSAAGRATPRREPATSARAVVAGVVGLAEDKVGHRDPGVESNARLTAATGLLLLVMLGAEGLTLASIHRLISWHIAIGLALVPPVALKLGSTLWRFSRYYLHDGRYRKAGPPHPLLRVLGPLVILTTVAVLASGIATWLAGPGSSGLRTLHQASFILWFGIMTIHVLAHVLRASRLTRADLGSRRRPQHLRGVAVRQGLVLASLVAGVVVALTTKGLVSGWSNWTHAGQ